MGCANCKIGTSPGPSVQQAKSGGSDKTRTTCVLGPRIQLLHIQGGGNQTKYHEFAEDYHDGGTLPLLKTHTASPTPEMTPRKAFSSIAGYATDPLLGTLCETTSTNSTNSTAGSRSEKLSESDGWKGDGGEGNGGHESNTGRDNRAAKKSDPVQGEDPVERLCTPTVYSRAGHATVCSGVTPTRRRPSNRLSVRTLQLLQQQATPQSIPRPAELRKFLRKHRPATWPTTVKGGGKTNLVSMGFPGGATYAGPLGAAGEKIRTGWGVVVLPGNIVYEGNWVDGRVHGNGALRLPNGNAYWGSWSNGRKHGSGTFVWADGSRYDGSYRAGKRSGVGTLRYATGALFKGQFECDLRHGPGCLLLSDGSSYDGQWASDCPHGHGVYIEAGSTGGVPGGERYEGSWNRGVRSGGGTLVQGYEVQDGSADSSGDKGAAVSSTSTSASTTAWYSGNFDAGLPHGDGVMGHGTATFCGHIEHGVWTGGGGRVDLGDGNGTFEGIWSNGLPRGRGRWCGGPTSGAGVDCTFKEGYAKLTWPG